MNQDELKKLLTPEEWICPVCGKYKSIDRMVMSSHLEEHAREIAIQEGRERQEALATPDEALISLLEGSLEEDYDR